MWHCIIIGAGISGLLAGTILKEAGHDVVVLEKGRGVGGRMATRRIGKAVCDHGAQFFTVRDPAFKEWVDRWRGAGLVESWYDRDDSGRHYRGVPSMTGIPKYLAKALKVHLQTVVSGVTFDDGWKVHTVDGGIFESQSLILTAPLPQSLAILEGSGICIPEPQLSRLQSVQYQRCLAVIAELDRPSALVENSGALKLDGEPIRWITDNDRKGISPNAPSVTIHSTAAFADRYWDVSNDKRIPILLGAARPFIQAEVVSSDLHRWGFSQPMSSFAEDAFVDREMRYAIVGDGLAGGRIEGAALSGMLAAAAIRSMIY